jgi:thymidylate synthase
MNKEHLHPEGRPYTKEEFVEKIKTDKSFAERFANLGPVYGKQWRSWGEHYKIRTVEGEGSFDYEFKKKIRGIDQIANVINELKTNPDSRRMIVNAWNVADLPAMVLPPCHMMFQFYTRELSLTERNYSLGQGKAYKGIFGRSEKNDLEYKELFDKENRPTRAISLMYYARSQDVPLGTPFNISSYSLLLMIIAKHVNMVPEELIANMGDCHIYNNQIEGIKEQLTRVPHDLPTVRISDRVVNDISEYEIDDFVLENYQYHPSIKLPLSN